MPTLRDFCLQHIAAYKFPRWIVFIRTMPRNPAGKILKTQLKEIFRDRYHAGRSGHPSAP